MSFLEIRFLIACISVFCTCTINVNTIFTGMGRKKINKKRILLPKKVYVRAKTEPHKNVADGPIKIG